MDCNSSRGQQGVLGDKRVPRVTDQHTFAPCLIRLTSCDIRRSALIRPGDHWLMLTTPAPCMQCMRACGCFRHPNLFANAYQWNLHLPLRHSNHRVLYFWPQLFLMGSMSYSNLVEPKKGLDKTKRSHLVLHKTY